MKILIALLATTAFLTADYIVDSEQYSISKHERNDYMKLVTDAFTSKTFSKQELQEALNNPDIHPMSDVLRVLAFDEVGNTLEIDKHLNDALSDVTQLKRDKEIMFAFCDVLLRTGKFDEISSIYTKEEALLMKQEHKRKAYYYLGVSKHLKDPEAKFSNEFLIIKYKFQKSQELYTQRRGLSL